MKLRKYGNEVVEFTGYQDSLGVDVYERDIVSFDGEMKAVYGAGTYQEFLVRNGITEPFQVVFNVCESNYDVCAAALSRLQSL